MSNQETSRSRGSFGFLGAAALAFIGGGLGGATLQYLSEGRQSDIQMVEIGLSILRADPKSNPANPAREWAIELVEKYSGLSFDPADRAALENDGIRLEPPGAFQGFATSLLESPITTPCEPPPLVELGDDLMVVALEIKAAYVRCAGRHEVLVSAIREWKDAIAEAD